MADQGQALRAELRTCDVAAGLHPSTQRVLKGHVKNASRQYKRAVARFGMVLILGCYRLAEHVVLLFLFSTGLL